MNDTNDHESPAQRANKPAPPPGAIPKNDAPHINQGAKSSDGKQENTLDRTLVRWTRVVGVFTAVLAVAGSVQTWAFIASERAFLSIINVHIEGDLPKVGENLIRVSFQTVNSGRSAASINYFTLSAGTGSLPIIPRYGNEPQRPIPPIPPNVTASHYDEVTLSRAITQADIDVIESGNAQLSIYGYVAYTDTFWFAGERVSGFCYTYAPRKVAGSQFVACQERPYIYEK